jgi:hypothetical protein
MCEYCDGSEKMKDDIYISKDKNKYYINSYEVSSWTTSKKTEINYCPICGRKLEG